MIRSLLATRFAAAVAVSALILVASLATHANAAEVKLLAPVSLRALLPEVLSQFEKSSGHKVTVEYATLGAITDRVAKGDTADVAMVSPEQNDDLQKQGKLLTGSRTEIARVGYVVFTKKGAPKPDVGSIEGLAGTLVAAKSIVLGDPAAGGGAGVFSAGLMDRLGLATEIK
jgi:molybdate transport system substrate-binding protein